ncbi:hypothetical protein BDB01DRAFT_843451 [Pilobolus umbonatus]|nr:hypothetical protein BDB01DRAFT_843451 [Pilobolus umbonatus]
MFIKRVISITILVYQKHSGIGLFAGYGATFIRDAPFAGIYLFFYEGCKSWGNNYLSSHHLTVANAAVNMGSGIIAGMAATCTTQPFDMLKTRMQLKPSQYRNLIQSTVKIFRSTVLLKYVRHRGKPKCLFPISNMPALEHLLCQIKRHFKHIYLLTNAHTQGVFSDLNILYQSKHIQDEIIVMDANVFFRSDIDIIVVSSQNSNVILQTEDEVAIYFKISIDVLSQLVKQASEIGNISWMKRLKDFLISNQLSIAQTAPHLDLMEYYTDDCSLTEYLENWMGYRNRHIRKRAYARVGLMGNPSDGFYGKTISLLISNFWAEAIILPIRFPDDPKGTINIMSVSGTLGGFCSLQSIANREDYKKYASGDQLVLACIKAFYNYHSSMGITLDDREGFDLYYESNIPQQVGLAGSSAIITAVFNCLLELFEIDIPLPIQANIVLSVEQDILGITAGLQDRVIQAYGGLVYMDFNKEHMDKFGYGIYKPLDMHLLPDLWLAYANHPSDSGKVHNNIKQRFLGGDQEIIGAMKKFTELVDSALQALELKDYPALADLMTANFNHRRSIYGDKVIGADNLRMIGLAKNHHCVAKFPGSGGAIVGMWNGSNPAHRLDDLEALKIALVKEGYVFCHIVPKEI